MNKDNIEEEKIEAQYFYLAKWMDGKCTLEALKKHVSQDDINAYKKLKDGLEVYEYLNAPTKASFVKIKSRINKKKKKTQQLYKQIALSAAAVVTVLLMLNLFVSTNKFSYSTEYAEHKSINLPDGSEVILNAKSQLTFNKKTWNNNRELYLNGEAYFKVKTGNTFTVKTDNGSVLVLGTQFNVNAYNEDFKVNCYEGEVKVISNNNTTVLKP
ncbi:FecR family protein, partial [Lacinutrix sp.]|uniref:FecR family protein n=1 Tax=Lacinutrix sp. TaxID=1937692 RepID=UPI0025C573C3